MKSSLLNFFFSILFCLPFLSMQGQMWAWGRGAQGGGGPIAQQEGGCASVDPSGNVIFGGSFIGQTFSFGPYVLNGNSSSASDPFLVKLDTAGNILWAKQALSDSGATITSIATDQFSNIYLTGYFGGAFLIFDSDSIYNHCFCSKKDIFVVKLNPAGNTVWAKSVGGKNNETGTGISIGHSGNIYVAGYFNSDTIFFSLDTLVNTGLDDIFIFKFDNSGNEIWGKSFGGNSFDYATSIGTDFFENIYFTGSFRSPLIVFDNDSLFCSSTYDDFFLSKLDSSGHCNWAHNAAGNSSNWANSISVDRFGHEYCAGQYGGGSIIFQQDTLSQGSIDAFLVAYDVGGNVLWAKKGEGSAFMCRAYCVNADTLGNIFLSGNFDSQMTFGNAVIPYPNNPYDPMFVLKLDTSGNVVCSTGLPSGADDVNAIAGDGKGNAYCAGDFEITPFIIGYDSLLLTTGMENAFVAKFICGCIPDVNIVGNDSVCRGMPVTLTAYGAQTYLWLPSASPINPVTYYPTSTTTYSVVGISSAGCSDTAFFTVVVDSLPLVSLDLTATDSVCLSDPPFLLTGGNPIGGAYSGTGVFSNTFYPMTGTGVYAIHYSYTDLFGCTNSATDSIRVLTCTGVPSLTDLNSIKLFPNPANDILTITSNTVLHNSCAKFCDAVNNILWQGFVTGTQFQINISQFPPGVYYLWITSDETTAIRKVVKTNSR